jgi:6-phospho-beta-glucosidase
MAVKIAIIGGGSAYAPGLLQAFITHAQDFAGAELALMDIAGPELEIVHRLGRKLTTAAGVDLVITATTDQQAAIRGADYVLTTFRQGGFAARHQDESIPLGHGVIGQETIGPGGFFFAMRTLPVIKSILADMARHAPRAVLVNYTNPTQIVAEAVTHFSDIPCLSICDQTRDDQRAVLAALAMPQAAVKLESVGLNHATWSTEFTIDGEDGVAVMLQHMDTVLGQPDVSARVKRQFRLAREYGRLPNSYLQYYYYREETVAEAQAANQTRAEAIMAALPGYFAHFEEQAHADRPVLSNVRGGSIFGDMAVEVLRGLIRQDGAIHTLNVPNRLALADFAPDRIVEAPARLERTGARPLAQGYLPSEVVGLLHMLAEYQWLAAEAIWHGDRRALTHALAANPLILSLTLAQRLLDDIMPRQRAYLPTRFFSD